MAEGRDAIVANLFGKRSGVFKKRKLDEVTGDDVKLL
jgi:hypothetical protein